MKHLLLLHGAIGAKDQLQPLAGLLQNDFTIHTLNFSGHGDSPGLDSFSIAAFADDVIEYLSKHDIERIDIFGYSMGGYVALFLARHFSERVGRVFTLATKFEWTPEIALRETKMLDAVKIAEKVPAFAKQLELRHQLNDWATVLSKTADMMLAMGENNPLQITDFSEIAHKVQIGIGDKDMMVTLEESIAMYRELPNADFLVLPHTPHPLEKVDAQRLAFEIKTFFAHG